MKSMKMLSRSTVLCRAATINGNAAAASAIRSVSTGDRRDGIMEWVFSSEAARHAPHSRLLSKGSDIYEVVTDHVTPKHWDDYVKRRGEMNAMISVRTGEGRFAATPLASWRYVFGDNATTALHVFRYDGGWDDVDRTRRAIAADGEFSDAYRKCLELVDGSRNELLKNFAFWPEPTPRAAGEAGDNIYDVRTYFLKAGSMYDWGNYWARGIKIRSRIREDIPWGGFFSQIGHLNVVHHIWVYKDLADRKGTRESSWGQEEWHEVVSNTVPLIRSMRTRILEPLPFSATK